MGRSAKKSQDSISKQELFEDYRKFWGVTKSEKKVNNQSTIAFGFNQQAIGKKFLGAKQGGPLPDFVVGMFPPPGWFGESIVDAREDVLKTRTTWSARLIPLSQVSLAWGWFPPHYAAPWPGDTPP